MLVLGPAWETVQNAWKINLQPPHIAWVEREGMQVTFTTYATKSEL